MKKIILLTLIIGFLNLQSVQALNYMGMDASPTSPNAEMPKYFLFESLPGQLVQDSVTVSNDSEASMNIRVYAVETEINAQGEEVLKAYKSTSEHLGQWITFDNQQQVDFTLDPTQSKEVKFTINIPAETSQTEYRGGIMIEKLNTTDSNLSSGVVIQTNGRVGIKTFLTVTDNPRTIKKLSEVQNPTPWTQIYFYVSLGLFIVVIGAFGVNTLRKKRKHHKK